MGVPPSAASLPALHSLVSLNTLCRSGVSAMSTRAAQASEGYQMNTQRLNERDRATLDCIMQPAAAVAETVAAAMDEFFRSDLCRSHIARVVDEELARLEQEGK